MSEEYTYSKCDKPMRHNIPRMGDFGGFVHADTSEFSCSGEFLEYMKYALFLDDLRFPKDAFLLKEQKYLVEYSQIPSGYWEIVRNYDDFVRIIQLKGLPYAVSFDCDLHREHMRHYVADSVVSGIYEWENFQNKCGIHCANYLKSLLKPEDDVKVFVHTANELGMVEIRKILKDYLA